MLDRTASIAGGMLLLAWAQLPHSRPAPKPPAETAYQVPTFCIPPVQASRPPTTVSSGDALQNALDRAVGGDTILLAAGATFRPPASEGSFVLRNRPVGADQWITVRSASSAFDVGGPLAPGVRVDASDAYRMPAIRAITPAKPAIRAEAGAHGYRLLGLDVGPDATLGNVVTLIEFGTASESTVDVEPSDIIVDRSYVHGKDQGTARRGVALNGRRLAVIDSYFENFRDPDNDAQAIVGWNGPGPFKIVNNFLEASGENIMFGGGDPAVPNLVPSDIEIRRNLVTKRLSWRSDRVAVKNALELKNARRVLIEGNTFEHVWSSGQDGTAIVFKSANQAGRCTWCVTEYVTFRNNIVRGASNGFVINAADRPDQSKPLPIAANSIRIQNVLFDDIGGSDWGVGGKLLRIFGGVANIEVSHITSLGNPNGILDPRDPADENPNLIFKNNIVERMHYGIGAGADEGITTISRNFGPFVYNQNVLVNNSGGTRQAISDNALKSRYPPVTLVAAGWNAVRFQEGSYKLSAASPYYRAGDDGKDLGVDMDALTAAQAGPSTVECGQVVPRPRAH
jgi:hypothetical protein